VLAFRLPTNAHALHLIRDGCNNLSALTGRISRAAKRRGMASSGCVC